MITDHMIVSIFIKLIASITLFVVPFYDQFRVSKWNTVLTLTGSFAFIAIATVLIMPKVSIWVDWEFLLECIFVLLYSVIGTFLFKTSYFKVLFVCLLLRCYIDNIAMLSKAIGVKLIPLQMYSFTAYKTFEVELVVRTLGFLLIWIFMSRTVRPLINTTTPMLFWNYLWLQPACFFAIYEIAISPKFYNINQSNTTCALSNGDFALSLLWTMGTFFSYYITLQTIYELIKNTKLQEKLHLWEKQVILQKQQYEQLSQNIRESARLRHDWRQHLLALKGYVQNKDYGAMEHYLEDYLDEYLSIDEAAICENHALDMIVRHYIAIANKNGVKTIASIHIPKEFSILDADLCVIFGNLIENAVEACLKQQHPNKFIEIKAQSISKKMVVINIKNSYEGDICYKEGLFYSTKHEGEGIGISSVRSIVEKIGGYSKFSYNNRIFKVYILLNEA